MASPLVYYFPATSVDGSNINKGIISTAQSYSAAGNIIINPSPFQPVNSASGIWVNKDMWRQVQFTTNNDLSALTVTITGLATYTNGTSQLLQPVVGTPSQVTAVTGNIGPLSTIVTESFSLPNSATASTQCYFKNITSMTISGSTGVNTVSVGYGPNGISGPIFLDYNKIGWYASIQGQKIADAGVPAGNLIYTIYQTLTKPEVPSSQYGSWVETSSPIQGFPVTSVGVNSNTLTQLSTPIAMAWAEVTGTVNDTFADVFYLTAIQQGITS
jgi:hypothetical protein